MTNSEAIKILKSKMDGSVDTSYEWCECIRMAIKALEQKSETVTEFADRCRECGAKYGKLLERTRCIPVSEKLPNDRGWYLGIFKEPDTGWVNPIPFVCDYVGHETKATTKEHWILRGFTDRDEHIDYYFNLECVAWMQLPKAL